MALQKTLHEAKNSAKASMEEMNKLHFMMKQISLERDELKTKYNQVVDLLDQVKNANEDMNNEYKVVQSKNSVLEKSKMDGLVKMADLQEKVLSMENTIQFKMDGMKSEYHQVEHMLQHAIRHLAANTTSENARVCMELLEAIREVIVSGMNKLKLNVKSHAKEGNSEKSTLEVQVEQLEMELAKARQKLVSPHWSNSKGSSKIISQYQIAIVKAKAQVKSLQSQLEDEHRISDNLRKQVAEYKAIAWGKQKNNNMRYDKHDLSDAEVDHLKYMCKEMEKQNTQTTQKMVQQARLIEKLRNEKD